MASLHQHTAAGCLAASAERSEITVRAVVWAAMHRFMYECMYACCWAMKFN